jgi:hypothetical protein
MSTQPKGPRALPAIPWLRRLFRPAPAGRRRPNAYRLAVEELECRAVPALTYGGGPVLANVGVEAVFYGQEWSTNSALQAEAQQIDSYFQFLTGSSVVDLLAQYSTPTQTIGHGTVLDDRVLPVALGASVDDGQIQAMLGNAIAGGQVQAPDANRLYFVFVEPGVVVTLQGQDSAINFLGYHNAFTDAAGAPAYYAVIPYQTSPNASIGGVSEFQSLTTVASHEFAEAVTDPDTQTGWRDYAGTGNEVGDFATQLPPVYLNGYAVQELYSDQAGGNVAPAGATAPPPGQGGDLSAAGQDVLATVGQPFSGVVALVSAGDPNAPGDLTATIDWGDGSAPDTVALTGPDANGYFEVAGSHTYLGSGVGTVSVTVRDTGTGAVTRTSSAVEVQGPSVNLSVAGQHVSATAGQTVTAVVALVSAADPNAPGDLAATIDWGDGRRTLVALTGPDANGYFEVAGSHTYWGTGTGTVQVLVLDQTTGAEALGSSTVQVTTQPPPATPPPRPRTAAAASWAGASWRRPSGSGTATASPQQGQGTWPPARPSGTRSFWRQAGHATRIAMATPP